MMTLFIILSLLFVMPSIVYMINNGTILGFKNYYNYFFDDGTTKKISSTLYIICFVLLMVCYIYFIKKRDIIKNIKQVLIFSGVLGIIFAFSVPWNSSDIFYYMGVGEINSKYGQNPYYVTIRQFCKENQDIMEQDTILKQGNMNYWANTTVVYGPIAQFIFSSITKVSFKNVDICLILFKIFNLIIHILNCFIIYKITKKLKFSIIYGFNPYVLLEFMGMVHNDIIVVFFMLLSLYFLLKKKMLLPSIAFLAIATGIKYFTILLLPLIILYYYKDEEKIWKRILRCIQYGVIFMVIFLLEYAIYFRNFDIFIAMLVQTERFCKSIYSAIFALLKSNNVKNLVIFGRKITSGEFVHLVRNIVLGIFVISYIKFGIDLLFMKKMSISKALRKYNFRLVLFILALSNFQQWYLLWLFATLPWQKSNTIRNIIGLSTASQIANSIYMYKVENYIYDTYFVGIFALIFLIWVICTNFKKEDIKNEETLIN